MRAFSADPRRLSQTMPAMLESHFAFLGSIKPVDGITTAYVCQNHTCQLPVTDPAALSGQLER